MNISKNILTVVVALAASFSCPQQMWAEESCDHVYTYDISSDGSYSVYCQKGCGHYVNPNHVVFYSTSDGNPITIKSSNFGANIVQICNDFIVFDGEVTKVGKNTFANSRSQNSLLQSIILPNSVTSIDESAFTYCKNLTSISFGNNVEVIGNSAFESCTKLSSIVLPKTLNKVGSSIFSRCDNLESVVLSSLPVLSTNSFDYVINKSSKASFSLALSEGSFVFVNVYSNAVNYPSFSSMSYSNSMYYDWGSVILPFNVKSNDDIQLYTFETYVDNKNKFLMKPVDNVSANQPFFYKRKNSDIYEANLLGSGLLFTPSQDTYSVPTGVSGLSFVGTYAESTINSDATDTYYLPYDASLYKQDFEYTVGSLSTWFHKDEASSQQMYQVSDEYGALYYTATEKVQTSAIFKGVDGEDLDLISNNYANGEGKILFDAPIGTIPNDAFKGKSALSGISFSHPSSLTAIGNNSFRESGLISFEVPENVNSIGSYAFYSCKSLTDITLPAGVTTIAESMLHNCSALTSVTMNGDVTTIGPKAFYGCSKLRNISLPNTVSSIGSKAFQSTGLTSITIPEGVKNIEDYTFSGCKSLQSVTFPSTIYRIGQSAFSGCNNSRFTSINLPNTVTSIGTSAFANCSYLNSVELPASVETIGNSAFTSCTSLDSVRLNSIPNIGYSIFTYAKNKLYVNIDDNSYVYKADQNNYWNNSNYNGITTATYTRTLSASSVWGTGILPFTAVSNEDIQYYQLKRSEGEAMIFTPVDTVTANTPFLFQKLEENATKVDMTGYGVVSVKASGEYQVANDANTFVSCGTYVGRTSSLTDVYFIAQNMFYYAEDAITVKPFRSWFAPVIPMVTPGGMSAPSLRIVIEDEEEGQQTAILEIAEDGTVEEITSGIYDMNGRELSVPAKGQINLVNGKRVFIK